MAAKKKARTKKKTASKSRSLATTSRNTEIVNYEERLASMAQADSQRGRGGGEGNWISTSGGIFSHNGEELPDVIYAIITDFTYENAYYENVYDPDNPEPPACFALADDPDELAPSASSPVMQVAKKDVCEGCPQNQYASSRTGKGKACKNGIRLSLVNITNANEELDISLASAASEPAFLRVAPTSLKHFEKYKNQITRITGKPLLGVVTEIEIVPEKTWFELSFNFIEEITDGQTLQNMLAVHDNFADALREEFDVSTYGQEKSSRGGSRNSGRGAAARRGASTAKKKTSKKKSAAKKKSRAKY